MIFILVLPRYFQWKWPPSIAWSRSDGNIYQWSKLTSNSILCLGRKIMILNGTDQELQTCFIIFFFCIFLVTCDFFPPLRIISPKVSQIMPISNGSTGKPFIVQCVGKLIFSTLFYAGKSAASWRIYNGKQRRFWGNIALCLLKWVYVRSTRTKNKMSLV